MKLNKTLLTIIIAAVLIPISNANAETYDIDKNFKQVIKQSLVHIDVTANRFENSQPWKRAQVNQLTGYGCAVGPYEVLTVAWCVRDATYIKVKAASQNEFVPAKVKVVDYESNLCLLTLDKNYLKNPLQPVEFTESFNKGRNVVSYRLTAAGHVKTGRGILDRADVNVSPLSFGRFLDYIVANAPKSSGRASLYCIDDKPIGLAHWAEVGTKETGLIPGVIINKFLKDAAENEYKGFPAVGFAAKKLIDPATRKYLKMPADLDQGVYLSKVHNLGTGAKELRRGDCILSIDGNSIDPYGKISHPTFEKIFYHHLISSHKADDKIKFTIWRDGKKMDLDVKAVPIDVEDMLIDFHEYDKQPEYIITGGYLIQKLSRPYMKIWGDNWEGKAPPHLYQYFRDKAFSPTKERQDIVVLSFVLPAEINQGYHAMGRQVITKINGMKINSFKEVPAALKAGMMSKFTTIEFEHDNPTVVIDRSKLDETDHFIAKRYGIQKLKNIR